MSTYYAHNFESVHPADVKIYLKISENFAMDVNMNVC